MFSILWEQEDCVTLAPVAAKEILSIPERKRLKKHKTQVESMILQFCKKKCLLESREDNKSLVFYLKFFSLYFHELTFKFFLFE